MSSSRPSPSRVAAPTMPAAAGRPAPLRHQRQRRWHTFLRNRAGVVGLGLAVLIGAAAIGAPLITWHDPLDQQATNRLKPPDGSFVMGRDTFGRDVFAR